MKILLLAPEPFYQERGTPIAVDLLLRALSARGEDVDVLTYHEGAPVDYPRVRIHRIPRLPFTHDLEPGPSLKKLLCDAALLIAALRMAARTRYQLVHAVEESVFIALIIKRLYGIPYVYDMDSSMADQTMAKYRPLRILGWWFRWGEGLVIRHAEVVVPVCDALAHVATNRQARRVVILRDVSLLSINGRRAPAVDALRTELGITGPIVMYVGNLQRSQGIDLLLESFAMARQRVPTAQLVIIGGSAPSIERYRARARRLGLDPAVFFTGPRPVTRLADYLMGADVLASPRLQGGNTPMKIYSYLHSGKAILATDLATHTQVLSADVAVLAQPVPQAFAEGMVRLLQDPALRTRLGQAGARLAEERYSYPVFLATFNRLYDMLSRSSAGAAPDRQASSDAGLTRQSARPLCALWVADKLAYGDRLHGLGHYYLNAIPALRDRMRVIPVILRATDGVIDAFRSNGMTLRVIHHRHVDPRTLWVLIRIIRTEQVDVLQLHGNGASLLGRLAGWLTRTPVILRQGDSASTPWYARISDRLLSRLAARTIAVSESVKTFCIRYRSLPADHILVLPNGIRPPEPPMAEEVAQWRKALRLPDHAKLIGSVTRFHPIKGVAYLVEAMPQIVRMAPAAFLVLWGDGPERAALEARARALGVTDHIRFDGYRSDAARRLVLLDCFVLPSLSEGSPNALLEALVAGRPIVATRAGGVSELVRDEEALLVPSRSAPALAEAISRVLTDETLACRLRRAAQAAGRRYDMDRYVLALRRLYGEVAPSFRVPVTETG